MLKTIFSAFNDLTFSPIIVYVRTKILLYVIFIIKKYR